MKLNELQTPYKRVKTISYGTGSKHNDPVYHWKELQQIGDSLYKDKEFDDKYNGKECCLYLMYAEADVALRVDQVIINTWQTVEWFVEHNSLNTVEHFIESLDNKVQNNEFIPNADIEFSKHFVPEKEMGYRKARQDYIDRKDREEQEYQKKCEQQFKREAEEQNQKSRTEIENALTIIKEGGMLENKSITYYDDKFKEHTYNLICYLAEKYSVNIPIKVKGWICNKLTSITFENEDIKQWTQYKSKCNTFSGYMRQIIRAVNAG
jgi:hypothetical protein